MLSRPLPSTFAKGIIQPPEPHGTAAWNITRGLRDSTVRLIRLQRDKPAPGPPLDEHKLVLRLACCSKTLSGFVLPATDSDTKRRFVRLHRKVGSAGSEAVTCLDFWATLRSGLQTTLHGRQASWTLLERPCATPCGCIGVRMTWEHALPH